MGLALFLVCLFAGAPPAVAGSDWPWWRGPHRDGVSRETEWTSEGSSKPLWKRSVGHGYSCVSVAAGRLFTLGFLAQESGAEDATGGAGHDVLWCLDAESGEVRWEARYPATRSNDQHEGGTLTTPAVDGPRVYVTQRNALLRCHASETGELVWRVRLRADLSELEQRWGLAGSPLVLDDLLVVNSDRTVGLDKESGEVKWRSREFGALYSTPQPLSLGERACIAVFAQSGVVVLDAADGATVHFYPWKRRSPHVNASTPIVLDGGRLFVSSGYGHGAALLDFSGERPVALWESRVLKTVLGGCVLVDGHFYGFDESMLKCVDLAGERRWQQRGTGMGSLSAAGDRLILLDGDGDLVIAAADPTGYRELSRAPALEGSHNWTSPVLANGLIYCRNGAGDLVCFDRRPRAGARDRGAADGDR